MTVIPIVAIIAASERHSRRHIMYGANTRRNGFHDDARPSRTPDRVALPDRSASHAPVITSINGHATWPSRRLEYAACVTRTNDATATARPGAAARAIRTTAMKKQAKLNAHQTATATGSDARHNGAMTATTHGGFRFGPRFASNGTYGSPPARYWRPD